jgi:hypothetical protein
VEPHLEGVDENSDLAKQLCCSTWQMRDCWVKAAKAKCDSMQVEKLHNLPYTLEPHLKNTCKQYPSGSFKCSFPVWLILVIVLIGVSLLALGIFYGIRLYRKGKHKTTAVIFTSRAWKIESTTTRLNFVFNYNLFANFSHILYKKFLNLTQFFIVTNNTILIKNYVINRLFCINN